MPRTESKIIGRVRKLLALALSDNPHEAANALTEAQRLMAKHRIDKVAIDEADPESIALWRDEPLETAVRIPEWKQAVGGAIAEVSDCLCLVSDRDLVDDRFRIMVVAGRREDFEVVRAMYRWIVATIERLATEAAQSHAMSKRGRGYQARWMHSFRTGAGAEVEKRVYQEQERQRHALASDPKTSMALDLRRGAVHEWAEKNIEQRDPNPLPAAIDRDAYEAGALAGRMMPLRGEREDGPAQ